jgi:hypothetical protein
MREREYWEYFVPEPETVIEQLFKTQSVIVLNLPGQRCNGCAHLIPMNCYAVDDGNYGVHCRDCIDRSHYGELAKAREWLRTHPCTGQCRALHMTAFMRYE